jgi:hypothetical protein
MWLGFLIPHYTAKSMIIWGMFRKDFSSSLMGMFGYLVVVVVMHEWLLLARVFRTAYIHSQRYRN